MNITTIKSILSMAISLLILNSNIMAQNIKPENDPNILKDIRSFLKVLNSGDGKPVEALAPKDARMVLVNAQKSVAFNYNDVEETEKKISEDGQKVTIHIMKAKGAKTGIPVFMFFHGGGRVIA